MYLKSVVSGFAVSLIAASSQMLTVSRTALVEIVRPPNPTREQIVCHDSTWEAANLARVEGVRLHKKLETPANNLLANGRAVGQPLGITSAYRSCAEQTLLRLRSCNGDVINRPAEACNPPTERPGDSLHNEGLAIDFNCRGYGNFGTSPCYIWLKSNAASAYLTQRPDEAWHWSTSGF